MRDQLFDHMQDLPIRYFDTHAHGNIMSVYTNDIDTLRQMISQSMPQMINSAITIVGVFIMMLILNVPLTLLTLVMVGITIFVTGKFAGYSSRYFLAQQENLGRVNGFIEEMMNGQKVVKVFNHEEENIEAFNVLNDELFDSAYNANSLQTRTKVADMLGADDMAAIVNQLGTDKQKALINTGYNIK